MYKNKIKWCPICDQGWIEIVKDIQSGELFCCCSECESEWNDPENITKDSCNKTDMYGQVCDPEESEIALKGWQKYII